MKWKTPLLQSLDLLTALAVGAFALWFSQFNDLWLPRVVFGFVFVFLASGYSASRLLPENASLLERIITSTLLSLLLTYPAAVLTVIVEGQSPRAIFGRHLSNSIASLFIFSILLSAWIARKKTLRPRFTKFPKLLLIPLAIYALLSFVSLNRADVFGDEYDLGYQAYNLVDGILAGRKAFTLSFSGHPPLVMDIKHFSMNILQPIGLDKLSDWQFRVSEALLGLLTIISVYALLKELYSEKAAFFGAILLSVNNYLVWMGRIFHREMYLTFFMAVSLYFISKGIKTGKRVYHLLAGISIGASLLSKESAAVLLLALGIWALWVKPRIGVLQTIITALLVFVPVIVYNVAAYQTTGYADVFFSNIFGFQRPGATPVESEPLRNFFSLLSLLWDIYSPLISLAFLVSLAFFLVKKNTMEEKLFLLWIAISLAFFSFTAIRSYYFLFMTIPLIVFLTKFLERLPSRPGAALTAILLIYSTLYSYNTNINRGYSRAEDIGSIDGPMILYHPVSTHFSLAARSWVEEVGYKNLQATLDGKIAIGDCLIVSDTMNSLAVRRYIGHADKIKEHYLGPDYPARYPKCPRDVGLIQGSVYFLSNKREGFGNLETVISDHLGNEQFFLYKLQKGTYV